MDSSCDLNVFYMTSSGLCHIFNQQNAIYPELNQKGFLHIMPPYKTLYICPNVLFIYIISFNPHKNSNVNRADYYLYFTEKITENDLQKTTQISGRNGPDT